MRNSDIRLCLGLVLSLGVLHTARADVLLLDGEARLTGSVRSIDESGAVGIESPLSQEPVVLKPGTVSKIEFGSPDGEAPRASSLIELSNGDVLPASVESMDEKDLTVVTTDSTRLVIPRTSVRSLQLGVHGRRVIYSGPKSLAEWNAVSASGGSNWTFADKALVTNSAGHAYREMEMPRKFVFKCSLKWRGSPSFRISFADPLKQGSEAVDRYYFDFNPGGFEVKREASTGRRHHTVIPSRRTPDQFSSSSVDVEIRVDRDSSRLELFLDGEPEGAGIDPVHEVPTGSGVAIVASASGGTRQEIRSIEIADFDNTRARHRAEDRGNTAVDSLISRDDDRWGGHLVSIRPGEGDEGNVFSFRSDFQEQPLELAEREVSTVFLATAGSPAAAAEGVFILRLRGEGSLHVDSCTFSGDSVTISHSLLGTMKIPRGAIAALERPGGKGKRGKTE